MLRKLYRCQCNERNAVNGLTQLSVCGSEVPELNPYALHTHMYSYEAISHMRYTYHDQKELLYFGLGTNAWHPHSMKIIFGRILKISSRYNFVPHVQLAQLAHANTIHRISFNFERCKKMFLAALHRSPPADAERVQINCSASFSFSADSLPLLCAQSA